MYLEVGDRRILRNVDKFRPGYTLLHFHEDPLSRYGVVHADILMGRQTRRKLMGVCVQFVANALRTFACLHENPRIPFTDDICVWQQTLGCNVLSKVGHILSLCC